MRHPLLADGVTRTVETVDGGCKVTIAWEFSGRAESDLVIEERFAAGWFVDSATVPLSTLDASWLSGGVARFAVKPAFLAEAGAISFVVVPGEGATSGNVAGDWKMYLGGKLCSGKTVGDGALVASAVASEVAGNGEGNGASGLLESVVVETAITITSFRLNGGDFELSYSGVNKAGTLVVEGCGGLGKAWTEIKRMAVSPGDEKVTMTPGEVGGSRFFKLKLFTEEE